MTVGKCSKVDTKTKVCWKSIIYLFACDCNTQYHLVVYLKVWSPTKSKTSKQHYETKIKTKI